MTNTDSDYPKNTLDRNAWIIVSIAFILACLIIFYILTPPDAQSKEMSMEQFSDRRAMEHIEVIAQEPHPMGSEEIVLVRRYIVKELEDMGLEPELQFIIAPDYFGIQNGNDVSAINILARLPGTNPTGTIALLAHYDTVPTTAGGNDCSACVAVLLETARALLAGPPLKNDVVLLFTDGEEPAPKYGAAAFVEQHPWAADIRMVILFEAVGSQGPSQMYETGYTNAWSIQEFSRAAPHPVAFSYLNDVIDLITSLSGGYSTDFGVFKAAGIDGFSFAHFYNSGVYHTPDDNIESVNRRSIQHHGFNALTLTRHFGKLELSEAEQYPQRDSIYFTLFPTVLVHYPEKWAFPLVIITGIALASAFVLGFRQGRLTIRGFIAGLIGSFSSPILLCLLTAIVWSLLVDLLYNQGWIVRNSGAHLFLAIFLLVSTVVSLGLFRRLHRRHNSISLFAGTLWWWWALSLLTAIWLPGFSYVFYWPMLLAGFRFGLLLGLNNPALQHLSEFILGLVVFVGIVLLALLFMISSILLCLAREILTRK